MYVWDGAVFLSGFGIVPQKFYNNHQYYAACINEQAFRWPQITYYRLAVIIGCLVVRCIRLRAVQLQEDIWRAEKEP